MMIYISFNNYKSAESRGTDLLKLTAFALPNSRRKRLAVEFDRSGIMDGQRGGAGTRIIQRRPNTDRKARFGPLNRAVAGGRGREDTPEGGPPAIEWQAWLKPRPDRHGGHC